MYLEIKLDWKICAKYCLNNIVKEVTLKKHSIDTAKIFERFHVDIDYSLFIISFNIKKNP